MKKIFLTLAMTLAYQFCLAGEPQPCAVISPSISIRVRVDKSTWNTVTGDVVTDKVWQTDLTSPKYDFRELCLPPMTVAATNFYATIQSKKVEVFLTIVPSLAKGPALDSNHELSEFQLFVLNADYQKQLDYPYHHFNPSSMNLDQTAKVNMLLSEDRVASYVTDKGELVHEYLIYTLRFEEH